MVFVLRKRFHFSIGKLTNVCDYLEFVKYTYFFSYIYNLFFSMNSEDQILASTDLTMDQTPLSSRFLSH